MNRSLANVILGGYGVSTGKAAKVEGVHQEIDVASTADILAHARSVIIVPGYVYQLILHQSSLDQFS